MRERYIWRDGRLLNVTGMEYLPPRARSDVACPMLIRDQMDPIKSMVDGKLYDSKSHLRRHYKSERVIELGNDAPTVASAPLRPRITKREIAAALDKVKQGYKPPPLESSIIPE